jgi:SAM-dependent methyltransferase
MARFEDPAYYGDIWAGAYDEQQIAPEPGPAVEFLAGLAGGGPVLELGIGTGRVALPLAARGIEVEGIDASAAIVARLQDKPGGRAIPVTIGDMADVPAVGPFRLAYLVFNSLFCLLSYERQADCFRHVAEVLDPGGLFVVECFVPDPARHGTARQRLTTQVAASDERGGVQLLPVVMRYSWPYELDEMATQAGLLLRERHGDWDRQPFGPASAQHVSVYERPGSA